MGSVESCLEVGDAGDADGWKGGRDSDPGRVCVFGVDCDGFQAVLINSNKVNPIETMVKVLLDHLMSLDFRSLGITMDHVCDPKTRIWGTKITPAIAPQSGNWNGVCAPIGCLHKVEMLRFFTNFCKKKCGKMSTIA